MTGFGTARVHDPRLSIEVEVRAVNNRHLKVSIKLSEPYAALEPELEQLLRDRLRRGAVQVGVRVERPRRGEEYRLNMIALESYLQQLEKLPWFHGAREASLTAVLALPGVVEEQRGGASDPHDDWLAIAAVVNEAVDNLQASRAREGQAMADELLSLGSGVEEHLGRICERGPLVVQAHQKRLTERVQALVKDLGVTVRPDDLIREVAILADRSDISEEIVRLRAHLEQYRSILASTESAGRKLEFVIQEIGREINTVGSKASDVEISRNAIEMKGLLEKIRELVQNVE